MHRLVAWNLTNLLLLRSKERPNEKSKRKVSHRLHVLVFCARVLAKVYSLLFKEASCVLLSELARRIAVERGGVSPIAVDREEEEEAAA